MEVIMHEASHRDVTDTQKNINNGIPKDAKLGNVKEKEVDPVEMEFRNISYRASLGFRKGNDSILFSIIFLFVPF